MHVQLLDYQEVLLGQGHKPLTLLSRGAHPLKVARYSHAEVL